MVHRSMENLKFDKRLASRRDWADPTELESFEKGLADVSEKGEQVSMDTATPSGDEAEPTPQAG